MRVMLYEVWCCGVAWYDEMAVQFDKYKSYSAISMNASYHFQAEIFIILHINIFSRI